MSNLPKMAALAIAVSDAEQLPYLAGALNGARAFFDWATALGYDATLMTDEEEKITAARLRETLEGILQPQNLPLQRLIIYFAGHGLIREAEEGLWLLSDWYTERRAVAMEVLKRRLRERDIQQIALFADACRKLPNTIQSADLTPDAVLGGGTQSAQRPPRRIDKFVAAYDGTATFAIQGKSPEEDRCLFTGVLLEGLWGLNGAALSKDGTVTSQSLGRFLEDHVPVVGARYGCVVQPEAQPNFRDGEDVYFPKGATVQLPVFPDWPDPPKPPKKKGPINVSRGGKPPKEVLEGLGGLALASEKKPEVPVGLAGKLLKQKRPLPYKTGSGFVITGAVAAVWTPETNPAEHEDGAPSGWWQVGGVDQSFLETPVPVLVEFDDGLYLATTSLPRFIGCAIRDKQGVAAFIYRKTYSLEKGEEEETALALSAMEAGRLSLTRGRDLAVRFRKLKHADPVMGAISAYIYDSLDDIESIRRMAFYYATHPGEYGQEPQPIPYDVALMGMLNGGWDNGHLWAEVPPVAARDPMTQAEMDAPWTHVETQAARGVVGGLWPWLRQGWTFLDSPGDLASPLIKHGLLDVRPHLTRSRFTTLNATGAHMLAEMFALKRNAK